MLENPNHSSDKFSYLLGCSSYIRSGNPISSCTCTPQSICRLTVEMPDSLGVTLRVILTEHTICTKILFLIHGSNKVQSIIKLPDGRQNKSPKTHRITETPNRMFLHIHKFTRKLHNAHLS